MTRSRTSRALAGLLCLLLTASACARGDRVGEQRAQRVLVVSIPGVAWRDLELHDLPHLEAFVRRAAVGDVATRIGRKGADPADAYLTMGAGSRAVAPADGGGLAMGPDDFLGTTETKVLLERRLGRVPEGTTYVSIEAAREDNDASAFGARPGAIGQALADAGVRRAVVANADLAETVPARAIHGRHAVAALMDEGGNVPDGSVSRTLLRGDAEAAFGVRVDDAEMLAAFKEAWELRSADDRIVALVETSDLTRATVYGADAASEQRGELRDDSLRHADEQLGLLLGEVDPATDAVLVISPVAPPGASDLAVVALRAPGVEPGMLRSPTTRRDGYVQLADVGPTLLALVGEQPPSGLEGRSFWATSSGRADRVDALAQAATESGFRDDVLPVTVLTFVAALALILVGALVGSRLPRRFRSLLPFAALAILGAVPATFLAAAMRPSASSTGPYLAVVLGAGAALGGLALVVDRRRPGLGPIVGVGLLVGLLVVDVLIGAPLQVNSVFGYSVAVAGRFAGVGNLAYALLGSGAVVLAGLVAERYGSRGVRIAIALLVVVALVDGLPILGADVGGVLSMVPAFGLTALLLLGRRPTMRAMVTLAVAGGATVLGFALVDLLRPSDAQTHLARLAEDLLDGRWRPLLDTLTRRWEASFGAESAAAWAGVACIVGATAVYVVIAWARDKGWTVLDNRLTGPARASAYGLGVLASVGLVVNDSSFAVPGVMLIVVVPVLVLREARRAAAPAVAA